MKKCLSLIFVFCLAGLKLSYCQCTIPQFIQAVPNMIFPCHNSCNGYFIINPFWISGTPPYTYTTTHGTILYDQPNPGWVTVTGLCDGDNVGMTILDANGCTGVDGSTIVSPPVANPTITVKAACNNTANGSVTISNLPDWYFQRILAVSTSNTCVPWDFCPGLITSTTRQQFDNGPYTVNNLSPGTYYFVVGYEYTDNNVFSGYWGCPEFIQFVVPSGTSPGATITPAGATTFCSGNSVLLKAPTGTNKTYQWRKSGVNIPGATSSTYTATASGNYRVKVTNTTSGCSKLSTNPVVVTVNALPNATVTPQGPTTFCTGNSVILKANTGTGLAYVWKKNNTNIPGATSANYTATTAGNYKVKVTKTNGCTKISSAVTVSVPCREEGVFLSDERFDFLLYPNPSEGEFTIQLQSKPVVPVQVEINDMMGRLIEKYSLAEESMNINAAALPKGIYTIKVQLDNDIVVKRISIVK